MISDKITFEYYLTYLLRKLVMSYNSNNYPHLDKDELSKEFYLRFFQINEYNDFDKLNNFIEYLKDFNNKNFIKNQILFNDIIIYLENIKIIMENTQLGFKIFQTDIILLNNDYILFKNKNLLKYYNECNNYYIEYKRILNTSFQLNFFLYIYFLLYKLCKENYKFNNYYYLSDIWYLVVYKKSNKSDGDLLKSFIDYLIEINLVIDNNNQSVLFKDIILYLNCFISILPIYQNNGLKCYFIVLDKCLDFVVFKNIDFLKYFEECKNFYKENG